MVEGAFKMVDSFADTVEREGRELQRRLEIDRVFSLPSGGMAFAGRAAAEEFTAETAASIEDDGITVTEREGTTTTFTEFVGVPGEFVVVGSSSGTFAFDMIGAETNTSIERATLDLDAFFDSHGGATPWKAGFYGNGDAGMSGVYHADDLRATLDLSSIRRESRLNQVGLSYDYDGSDVKMTAARSGYVEVYQPSDFDADDYLEYLDDEILRHVE